MRTLLTTPSPARRAAILGVSAAALAAAGWQYDRTGIAAFSRTAQAEPWLLPARSELSILDRVRLPWLDRSGILKLAGPKAIGQLDADPFVIDGMAGARHSIATYNRIGAGCGVLDRYRRIEQCSRDAAARRFRRIEANFARSVLDADYYVALAGNLLKLASKIRFSTAICNYYPAEANVTLAVRYHPSDRLAAETVQSALGPGECLTSLDRKLRHAPALVGTARARPPVRLAAGGQSDLVWRNEIAISDGKPLRAWALADNRLCHTSPSKTCGGVPIANPLAYAKALSASLANDQRFAQRANPLFKFTIGASLGGSAASGDFGAYVYSVEPGGPAAALGLGAGDRIISVGDTLTFSNADVMLAIDQHGARHGRNAPLRMEIARDGEVFQGQIALAFYKPYWDDRGYNGWWAFFRGFLNAFSVGTAGHFVCAGRSAFSMDSPDGLPETPEECRSRWALEGEAIAELYRTGNLIGSFVGSLVSPLTLILPRFLRVAPLFGSIRAGQVAHGVALAVIQQSISIVASARPGTTAGQMINDIQVSLPQTVAQGTLETLLLSR